MSQKFISLRTYDIQKYLTPEEKQQLLAIFKKINESRLKTQQPVEVLFVLNARDKFAQAALEAYIEAAQNDTGLMINEGTLAAMDAAMKARQDGIMAGPSKLPSL